MKKIIIVYFFFLLFFFSFFSSGVIDSQDGFQYLAVARNIYYNHEPTAPPYEYPVKNIHMTVYTGKDGKTYSWTGLGYSLAMLPAVAITDAFYRAYHIVPPVHFPLESDWLIFLLASFTNCFFGAMLGVILFLYLVALKLPKKTSLLMSFLTIVSTNLLVYTKHSMAHMMFIAFLVLSFYLLKRYSQNRNWKYMVASGLSYGIVVITYNQTFLLPFLSYLLYYFLLHRPIFLDRKNFQKAVYDGIRFLIGIIPFFLIYYFFEKMRGQGLENPAFIGSYTKSIALNFPLGSVFEGFYVLLFSPGRSFFLYSPILLVSLFFWNKIKKKDYPELVLFVSMFLVYVGFYATVLNSKGAWVGNGEYSWGPRYLTPIIPFGALVVGPIFKKLKRIAKLCVLVPLILLGLYIEILGITMPYQTKFRDLPYSFSVNENVYVVSLYSNLIPRFSPVFIMSKNLVRLVRNLPKTLDHGIYNVKFYDGIDFPFNVGGLDRWRVIDRKGYLSFDNSIQDPIKKISFNFINHPLNESASSSAYVNVIVNNDKLFNEDQEFPLTERKYFELPSLKKILRNKKNEMIITVNFDNNTEVIKNNSQFLAMMSMFINGREVNKETIDMPYLSDFGAKTTGIAYQNWGTRKIPWENWHKSWDIHTQIFERVPDFWWAKIIYYWDIPKKTFAFLFIINILSITYFGYKVYAESKKAD